MDNDELVEGHKSLSAEQDLKQVSKKESGKQLTGAAIRALEEANQRRQAMKVQDRPPELFGPNGLDPVRYGDWEKNGLISDF